MTISLDKTTLTTITRPNFTFSQETITASTDTSEGDEDFEEINSVTAVINQTEDNVTITGGDTSVAIVGTYANPFSDTFTYVDGDSSDKLMTPITVVSEDNVPEDKIFFTLSFLTVNFVIFPGGFFTQFVKVSIALSARIEPSAYV